MFIYYIHYFSLGLISLFFFLSLEFLIIDYIIMLEYEILGFNYSLILFTYFISLIKFIILKVCIFNFFIFFLDGEICI